jgi:hypothetical protein
MFIGHEAVAFAAKRVAPRVSLGVLVGAATLLDLIWPILVLLGVEQVRIEPGNTKFTPLAFVSYPYTHSLLAALLWSVAAAVAWWIWKRSSRDSAVVGLLVFSHWVLDWITHRPDLPLAPGSSRYFGLSLWNHVAATFVVESAMFLAGLWIYSRTTRATGRTGRLALVGLVLLLVVIYVMNFFGPPPPSVRAIGFLGLAGWLIPLWAWWIDRHRAVKESISS